MQGNRLFTLPLILFVAACAGSRSGGSAEGGATDSSAGETRTVPAVAFRLRAGGGPLRVYSLPGLAETPTGARARVSPARSAIGVDMVGRRLLYRDSAGATIAFDLVANRERAVSPAGALAALASDGTLLTVDAAGAVTESQPWGTRRWTGTLGRGVDDAFAGPGARLIAIRRQGGDTLQIATREAGVSLAAPVPRAADEIASRDGDAVAFATDSGVVVIEDREAQRPWFVPLSGKPRAIAFSPSGHRLYVGLREKSELAVVDRYTRRERPAIALPAPAAVLRLDPWGRAVLAGPSGGDETWVVGTARELVTGGLTTPWAYDLPAVAEDGVVLLREGAAVVARDLGSLDSLGAVADGAGDLWFVGRFAPSSSTSGVRRDVRASDPTRARAPSPRAAPASLWVQVSNTQSEQWARALASELTAARHPAEVQPPDAPGGGWRVVMGPFRSRDAADSSGRSLGRPYWIFERAQRPDVKP
ncbi:MAG: SPOR domain-containing protein [Gemmatimonadota bacterium]